MLDVRKGEVYPTAHHENTEGEYRKSSALSLTPVLERVGSQRHTLASVPAG